MTFEMDYSISQATRNITARLFLVQSSRQAVDIGIVTLLLPIFMGYLGGDPWSTVAICAGISWMIFGAFLFELQAARADIFNCSDEFFNFVLGQLRKLPHHQMAGSTGVCRCVPRQNFFSHWAGGNVSATRRDGSLVIEAPLSVITRIIRAAKNDGFVLTEKKSTSLGLNI